MKTSVFTVSMPEYDLEETVAKLRQFGYDGVEWRVQTINREEPKPAPSYWGYNKSTVDIETVEEQAESIKAICDKENMKISALATYLVTSEVEKIESVLKASVVMNCPMIRVNVPHYNGQVNYNELFSRTRDEIKVLEQLAKKYNKQINFEIHMGNIIPSASAAYRLVSGFDSRYIGIIHDAGNMVYEGFEQYKMGFELLGDYLHHVHIKNARWAVKETTPEGVVVWNPEWCPVKAGQAKLKDMIHCLKELGYDGYLSIEDFSNEQSVDEKLKDNLEFIKSAL